MIAGVDGTRTGWVAVLCEDDLSSAHAVCLDRLTDLPRGLRVVAIDIPIGLSEKGPRQADHLARMALGPRRSSVFPTPVRAVLGARSWKAAVAGAPMSHAKKSPAGRVERLAVIAATFGHGAFDDAYAHVRGHRVGWDDLADAFALAWTAARIRAGIAKPHPAEQVVDREGIPMRIWT